MASLFDRELKLFFTSPLFMSLDLLLVVLTTVIKLIDLVPDNLLSTIWLMIVLYSTYFELGMWRKWFLNRGFKIKMYASSSPYTPFLSHSAVSLLLLELKTLVFVLPYLISMRVLNLLAFLIATHINWLLSLSLGVIFSKEVFNKMADSTAAFLCISAFNTILFTSVNQYLSTPISLPISFPPAGYWPIFPLGKGEISSLIDPVSLAVLILSIVLYATAVYMSSKTARNILVDDS